MAAIEMQQQHHAFNPTLTTTQAIMPEKPRVPIVAHIITDDDIGVLKVTLYPIIHIQGLTGLLYKTSC